MKFQKKEDELDPDSYLGVKNDYKNLAKSIDEYQKTNFKDWNERIRERAMGFLKQKILVKNEKYEVNFSQEFKVLIKEAKHLEKMGYPISKTIINISLQEKEYYIYIDKLHSMLNEYYDVVDSLSEIEKILLEQPINKLNK